MAAVMCVDVDSQPQYRQCEINHWTLVTDEHAKSTWRGPWWEHRKGTFLARGNSGASAPPQCRSQERNHWLDTIQNHSQRAKNDTLGCGREQYRRYWKQKKKQLGVRNEERGRRDRVKLVRSCCDMLCLSLSRVFSVWLVVDGVSLCPFASWVAELSDATVTTFFFNVSMYFGKFWHLAGWFCLRPLAYIGDAFPFLGITPPYLILYHRVAHTFILTHAHIILYARGYVLQFHIGQIWCVN